MITSSLAAMLALPHDPASIFVYVLVLVALGGILWAGRPRNPGA